MLTLEDSIFLRCRPSCVSTRVPKRSYPDVTASSTTSPRATAFAIPTLTASQPLKSIPRVHSSTLHTPTQAPQARPSYAKLLARPLICVRTSQQHCRAPPEGRVVALERDVSVGSASSLGCSLGTRQADSRSATVWTEPIHAWILESTNLRSAPHDNVYCLSEDDRIHQTIRARPLRNDQ